MTPNMLLRKSTSILSPSLLTRSSLSKQHWLTLLTWMTVLALFIIGIWMRLYLLDVPFDRNSYDEGVYWQSLHSMTTGASLYQQIFYSQPPFFLISLYPFYTLFGQTIWSARLGIVVISLFGFLGALLLGKALAGRWGMLLALLLLVINPLYLRESQTLQADAPSTALMLLAVGLAYQWWERPRGLMGYFLATLAAITLALSILTKLLAAPALAPIGPASTCIPLEGEKVSGHSFCLDRPTPARVHSLRSDDCCTSIAIQPCILTVMANSCDFPYSRQNPLPGHAASE